ncbi:uncharacterized protein DFL_001344 [Arthrobotrys flagrans]|uniref:Uncharacterized protein n=1 Tax=Arthrobotrys flagrans TaxID=97331 RepID=A0A437AH32_ARTFL|nr:hypothetical protein DFL_001344 [Arthrobotrys flagrans]
MSSELKKLNPHANVFTPGADGFDATAVSLPDPKVSPRENTPPPAPELLPKKAKERAPKDIGNPSDLGKVLIVPAPKESPETSSIKPPTPLPKEEDSPKETFFFGDIQVKTDNPGIIEPAGKYPNIPVPVPEVKVADRTLTPEIIRNEELKRAVAENYPSKIPATILEQIARCARAGSPDPDIPSFGEFLNSMERLTSRALDKGYRQPLNALYNPNYHDTWDLGMKMGQYYYNEGLIAVADLDDPVQVLTDNEGMVRYELWNRVWLQIRKGYLHESFFPDPRAISLHKDMTHKLIPILQREVGNLIKEMCRDRIYTPSQIVLLDRGVKERTYWLEHLEKCLDVIKIFEKVF